MQEMIKKLIEMDKEARRLTDEARQRKAGSTEAAARKRREVFDGYLWMASNRVDTIRKVEMENADEQAKAIDERCRKAEEAMRECAQANRERWISQIVAAVTEGDDSQ